MPKTTMKSTKIQILKFARENSRDQLSHENSGDVHAGTFKQIQQFDNSSIQKFNNSTMPQNQRKHLHRQPK